MARIKNNALLEALSGKIGNLVFKNYQGTIILSSAPDRSKVVLSSKQKTANGNFKEAVRYAKDVLANPEKRKAYEAKLKPGKTVYHTAVAEYLQQNKTPLSL